MFFPVHVEEDGSPRRDGVCCDISGSGMQLAMAEQVGPGARVVLSFDAPGGDKRRTVTGRVVRSGTNDDEGSLLWPAKIGVEFDLFDPVLAALSEK
jgi:hypothetical protein